MEAENRNITEKIIILLVAVTPPFKVNLWTHNCTEKWRNEIEIATVDLTICKLSLYILIVEQRIYQVEMSKNPADSPHSTPSSYLFS